MDKEFKSYEEMLNLLSDRGINLEGSDLRGRSKVLLQHYGYYNLVNGYKKPFLMKDSSGIILVPETYIPGTTIEDIYALYRFDCKLRYSMLQCTLDIETNLKSLISYTFSNFHGHKNYLVLENFDNQQKDGASKIVALIADLQKQLAARSSDPSIQHYLSEYGYVPLWVLNNILTFGQISKFYSLMLPSERAAIAKKFHVQHNELTNMLTILTQVRNLCAHSNRLYCFRTKRPLSDLPAHAALALPMNVRTHEYIYGKRDFCAVLITMYYLLPRYRFKQLIKTINKNLYGTKFSNGVSAEDEILSAMGLPIDWSDRFNQI